MPKKMTTTLGAFEWNPVRKEVDTLAPAIHMASTSQENMPCSSRNSSAGRHVQRAEWGPPSINHQLTHVNHQPLLHQGINHQLTNLSNLYQPTATNQASPRLHQAISFTNQHQPTRLTWHRHRMPPHRPPWAPPCHATDPGLAQAAGSRAPRGASAVSWLRGQPEQLYLVKVYMVNHGY